MITKMISFRGSLRLLNFAAKRSFATKSNDQYAISQLLQQVEKGSISANEAEKVIRDIGELNESGNAPDETLRSFANLDHRRSSRTGFPEAIFSAGKTPSQIAAILDDMAGNVNEFVQSGSYVETYHKAILATR